MNYGKLFVIEASSEQMLIVKQAIKRRIWNYTVVLDMPFGLAIGSIDGVALDIPVGETIPSLITVR